MFIEPYWIHKNWNISQIFLELETLPLKKEQILGACDMILQIASYTINNLL